MEQQTKQAGNSKQEQVPKDIFVVNDDFGREVFLDRLDHFAKNQLKVAINPSFTLEMIFAEVRQRNFFLMIEYDPNKMSHMIATVMPQMTDLADTIESSDQEDPFEGISSEYVKDMFEYPEK